MKKIQNFKLTTKSADLISFTLGFIGLFFGILSLLALTKFWRNSSFSYDISVIAVIFDTLSAIFALVAFQLGFQNYREKKKELTANNLVKAELVAINMDMCSFMLGIVGWTLEVLSIVSLSHYWFNPIFSYNVTFAAIIINLSSTMFALIAFLIVSKIHF